MPIAAKKHDCPTCTCTDPIDTDIADCIEAMMVAHNEAARATETAVEVCPECDIAGCRHIRERQARADLSPTPAGVKVKPLNFADETGDGVLTSRETGELYRVFPQSDGKCFAPKVALDSFGSQQEAIAACNEHNRRRVIAALEPTPADPLGDERVRGLCEAVQAVLNAADQGRMVERGAGGMTIEAQIRRSVYNGVPVWPFEELRAALAALKEGGG